MIYITLPNFYFNYKLVNAIDTYFRKNKNYLKTQLSFYAATGNMPYMYWNGGFNNCSGMGAYYDDLVSCADKTQIPLRFNCSNIYLTEEDFTDTYANLMFELNNNGSNTIELSNLRLYEYLHKKYPFYKFTFSKEAEYYTEITTELINRFIDLNLFRYISVPTSKVKDMEFINKISNKKILEIPINCECDVNCKNYNDCKISNHECQYNFSKKNIFNECALKKSYDKIKPIIQLDEIMNTYVPLGINHFTLGEVASNKEELLKFIIEYFVKDEYQYITYKEIGEMLNA